MEISPRRDRSMTYLGMTRSTCPRCLDLVNARILTDGKNVFFRKFCPAHGHSRALISEDVAYYLGTREYAHPGSVPHHFSTEVKQCCPNDCGLCPDHQQHTCHPIVEITDVCNLSCPICIADNRQRGFLPPARFWEIVQKLVACEGHLENITLSGGEPSCHPEFLELVDIADRPEVSRVSLVTNGLRIAEDEDFVKTLKDRNLYVILQWDGFDDTVYRKLRGCDLMAIKERALDRLVAYGISTQLIFTAARGINEDQMGQAVRLLLETENILSLAFQPLAFPRNPEKLGNHDPMDRITIPGAIENLVHQSDGIFKNADFIPLPCPNPECVALTYLLDLGDSKFVPFPRFLDMKKHLQLLRGSATIEPSPETEEALHGIINDLGSTAGEIPDSERIIKALRRAVLEMFPKEKTDQRDLIRASERQAKSVFLHHYMDRYNFDLSRVVKCCHHYPRADGRIMPICTFNLFHRKKEENPFVALK